MSNLDDDLGPGVLHRGGGWISGTPSSSPSRNERRIDRDERPSFNPAALVYEVERILAEHGLTVTVDASRRPVAEIAAADLLRAIGINPASAPWRAS